MNDDDKKATPRFTGCLCRGFYRPPNCPVHGRPTRGRLRLGISSGYLVGSCTECGQPATGELDSDKGVITMECVNCHHQQVIKFANVFVTLEAE